MQVFLELALSTYKSDTHVERDGTSVTRYNSEAEFIHVPSFLGVDEFRFRGRIKARQHREHCISPKRFRLRISANVSRKMNGQINIT